MKYLLDTDILIYFLKGHPIVFEAFNRADQEDLATSIINQGELLYGAFNSEMQTKNLKKVERLMAELSVLPYDEESAYLFAKHKADCRRSGCLLMDADLMIAAVALRHQLILVTNNQKHFARIKDLKLENWSQG